MIQETDDGKVKYGLLHYDREGKLLRTWYSDNNTEIKREYRTIKPAISHTHCLKLWKRKGGKLEGELLLDSRTKQYEV